MLKKLWFGIIQANSIQEVGIKINKEKERKTDKALSLFHKNIIIKDNFWMERKMVQVQ